MSRRIPGHLAPPRARRPAAEVESALLGDPGATVVPLVHDSRALHLERHPFDPEPEELLAAPAAEGDHELEGEVHAEEGEPEQEHVDGAESHAESGEEPDGGGQDGEESHGAVVPQLRPFDPVQLREGLTRWCDGLVSLDDRAVGLHQVEQAAGAIADARGELVDKLVEDWPRNDRGNRVPWTETPVGILKKDRSGGSSNWDAEMIWPDLLTEARRRCANPETGELSPEAEAGAVAMLAVLKEVVSSPSFRVRALEKLGIDPDQVRSTTPSRTIVRFA